jgi:hypothetical protein
MQVHDKGSYPKCLDFRLWKLHNKFFTYSPWTCLRAPQWKEYWVKVSILPKAVKQNRPSSLVPAFWPSTFHHPSAGNRRFDSMKHITSSHCKARRTYCHEFYPRRYGIYVMAAAVITLKIRSFKDDGLDRYWKSRRRNSQVGAEIEVLYGIRIRDGCNWC